MRRRIFPVIAIALLILRALYGMDLSDEMQYIGQIESLLREKRLFATDLFFQQFCYAIFYPLLNSYYFFFGDDCLILFIRLLTASLCFIVFIFTRMTLEKSGVNFVVAGILSISMMFCIPYHNIFSLSYNTLSQFYWILFLLIFWKRRGGPLGAIISSLTLITHPLSGAAMSFLALTRMFYEKNYKEIAKFTFTLLACLILIFYFSKNLFSLSDLINSVKFSAEISRTSSWLDDKTQFGMAFIIFIALILIPMCPSKLLRRIFTLKIIWLFWAICAVYLVRTAFFVTPSLGGFWPKLSFIFNIFMLVMLGYLFSILKENCRLEFRWLIFALTAYFLSLVITSGNGFTQSMGSAWVSIIILTASIASFSVEGGTSTSIKKVSMTLLAICFLCTLMFHWIFFPFKSPSFYRASELITTPGPFRYLHVSKHQKDVLEIYSSNFKDKAKGEKLLIASQYPALYMLLGEQPATCMLFMHSVPNTTFHKLLKECIISKKPSAILQLAFSPDDFSAGDPLPGELITSIIRQLNFNNCTQGNLFFPQGEYWTTNNRQQFYKYCTQ